MKRLACVVALTVAGGTAALAADLPPPVPPAAYIPVAPPYPYNWSGFYIGGNLGAGFSNSNTATDTFGSTFGTAATTSFLGGGQVGVNYELWSFFVIGAEVMFDWLPNSQNTVNVTNKYDSRVRDHQYRRRYPQQSMGNDGDRQGWLRL